MPVDDEGELESRRFTRRAMIAGGVQAAVFAALGTRLYQLQVVDGAKFKHLAESNRISEQPLLPRRGRILDRSGRMLAFNVERFGVFIRPGDRSRMRSSLKRLAALIDLKDSEIEIVIDKAKRSPRGQLIAVRGDIDFDTVARIGLAATELPGIEVAATFNRAYAYGLSTGHAVGHTGSVERLALDDAPLLSLPGVRIGKTGVESGMDAELRGKPGVKRMEVDARGDTVRVLSEIDATAGRDVVLTIDAALQERVMQRLAGEARAAVVVLDVVTGEVAVMASVPGYDPNLLTVAFDEAAFAKLQADPHDPLFNRATAGAYPPGSTFKMVTALAALDANAITARDTVTCSGAFHFADETFRCWNRGGHGAVDLAAAIRQSCDVYFYTLAERIGVDRIAAMARKLGLGQSYACGIAGQGEGLIPTTGWKRSARGEGWLRGETILAGIGQGYVLATPLQLAVMTARLATGRAVVPTIVRAKTENAAPDLSGFPPLDVPADWLAAVRQAMIGAVHAPDGTGGNAAPEGGEVFIAGKTGTSQVWASERQGRTESDRYELRDHALFVSFFPALAPRFSIAAVVEHGGSGGASAAPLVRDIVRMVLADAEMAAVSVPGGVR